MLIFIALVYFYFGMQRYLSRDISVWQDLSVG